MIDVIISILLGLASLGAIVGLIALVVLGIVFFPAALLIALLLLAAYGVGEEMRASNWRRPPR